MSGHLFVVNRDMEIAIHDKNFTNRDFFGRQTNSYAVGFVVR